MTTQLENKTVVVTGGAQGIGRAIAERMADAGATVVVGDMKQFEDERLNSVFLDVTDENSVSQFVAHVVETFGAPSVLVNNAGILAVTPLIEQSVEEWDRVMAINLRGPFLMAKHVVPHMLAETAPTIVNIGSINGMAGNPDTAAYIASKAGVHGLTMSMAIDLGAHGIRVNAIAPGWINTDINKVYMDAFPDPEEGYRQLAKLHPIGHIGEPSDIGDVAVWLASAQSRFVTGQVISVEGGRLLRVSLPAVFDK